MLMKFHLSSIIFQQPNTDWVDSIDLIHDVAHLLAIMIIFKLFPVEILISLCISTFHMEYTNNSYKTEFEKYINLCLFFNMIFSCKFIAYILPILFT